ncbi:MFS transporter [Dellaglioa sp. BT-FLS60]
METKSKASRLSSYNNAIVASENDPSLSPETGLPLRSRIKARYVIGFLIFGILWMVGIQSVAAFIIPLRLKGMVSSPESVIAINGIVSSVFSLLANIVFGSLSDRSHSRFGRRTPWIIGGATFGGLFMFLTGVAPNAFLMVTFFGLAMAGLNMMIAPVVAMLSDRIPKGSRGTMSSAYGAGQTVGAPMGTLLATQLISHQTLSAIIAGGFMLISGIVLILMIPREPAADFFPKKENDFKSIVHSFQPPKLAGNSDFYKAFVGRLFMLMSYQMIVAYQLYIVTDYIGLGTKSAAATISVMSIITMIVSLVGPLISGPLSDKFGMRKLPVVCASILFAIGVALPWMIPSRLGMILFAVVSGLGYGIYSSVDQALNVDVLSNKEEAGKDLGILNLATTLGQMIGPVLTSWIVISTGGYSGAFITSIVLSILGSISILLIKRVK